MLTPKIDTSELATAVATAVLFVAEMGAGEIWQLDASVACYIKQGTPAALVFGDLVFTAEADDEKLTAAAHGLLTGDGPFRISSDTALPTGLSAATDYWIIKFDANVFYLATSLQLALTGTNVTFTTDGTGVHTISDKAETKRVSAFIAAAATGSMYRPAGSSTLLEPGYDQGTRLTIIRAAGDGAVTLTKMRERPEFAGA